MCVQELRFIERHVCGCEFVQINTKFFWADGKIGKNWGISMKTLEECVLW